MPGIVLVSEARCVQDLGPYSQMSSLSMFLHGAFPATWLKACPAEEHEKYAGVRVSYRISYIFFSIFQDLVGLEVLNIFCLVDCSRRSYAETKALELIVKPWLR